MTTSQLMSISAATRKLDFLNPHKVIGGLRGLLLWPFFHQCGFPIVIEKGVKFAQPKTAALGKWVRIRQGTQVLKDVKIGDGVFIGHHCDIGRDTILESQVTLSDGVCILGDTHEFDNPAQRAGKTVSPGTTTIGKGAWIGYRVIILPQVRSVGKGAVIGAGSVVTKDIPENAIAVGNPARVIRILSAADPQKPPHP